MIEARINFNKLTEKEKTLVSNCYLICGVNKTKDRFAFDEKILDPEGNPYFTNKVLKTILPFISESKNVANNYAIEYKADENIGGMKVFRYSKDRQKKLVYINDRNCNSLTKDTLKIGKLYSFEKLNDLINKKYKITKEELQTMSREELKEFIDLHQFDGIDKREDVKTLRRQIIKMYG